MGFATIRQPVSLRRVALLLVLSLLLPVAATPAGQRWADRVAFALQRGERPEIPAWCMQVDLDPRKRLAWNLVLLRLFPDSVFGPDRPAEDCPAVTAGFVAERLRAIEGWSQAVLFPMGAGPEDLFAAGLDDRETCLGVARRSGRLSPGVSYFSTGPDRYWFLVLLDEQGVELCRTQLCDLRPGYVREGGIEGSRRYRVDSAVVLGAGPPPATVLRRTATGEVVSG